MVHESGSAADSDRIGVKKKRRRGLIAILHVPSHACYKVSPNMHPTSRRLTRLNNRFEEGDACTRRQNDTPLVLGRRHFHGFVIV